MSILTPIITEREVVDSANSDNDDGGVFGHARRDDD